MLRFGVLAILMSIIHSTLTIEALMEDTLPLLLKFFHEKGKSNIGQLLHDYETELKKMKKEGNGNQEQNQEDDPDNLSKRADQNRDNNLLPDSQDSKANLVANAEETLPNNGIYTEPANAASQLLPQQSVQNPDNNVQNSEAGNTGFAGNFGEDLNGEIRPEQSRRVYTYFQSWPQTYISYEPWHPKTREAKTTTTKPQASKKRHRKNKKAVLKGTGASNSLDINLSLADVGEKSVVVKIPVNIYFEDKGRTSSNFNAYGREFEEKPSLRSIDMNGGSQEAKDIAMAKRLREKIRQSKLTGKDQEEVRRLLINDEVEEARVNVNV